MMPTRSSRSAMLQIPSAFPAGETNREENRPQYARFVMTAMSQINASATKAPTAPMPMAAAERTRTRRSVE